jgi:class 3 adenylate cyclase
VLLFFSGHGIKDERGNLYLATSLTRKTERGELLIGTTVPASLVHYVMNNCRSKRQVAILDCCFSGAFAEGLLAKEEGAVDIRNQLGGEGRIVLTSSTSTEYSFQQKGEELSIYTRYLVEGIETGAADLDCDGMVTVDELHEYAKEKVQEALPAMNPEIYIVKEGDKIELAKAPTETVLATSAIKDVPLAPQPIKSTSTSGGLPNLSNRRTLATIVFTDGVGFSARMAEDEEQTLELIRRDLQLMRELCQQFEGYVIKSTGDGLLMCFGSVVQGVNCGIEIQKSLTEAAASLPTGEVLNHRIGIHLGDVFVKDNDVMGNGVNIAARLESKSQPGGICLSQTVYDLVKNHLKLPVIFLGNLELKNIPDPMPSYLIQVAPQPQSIVTPNLKPRSRAAIEISPQEYRDRQTLLDRVRNAWIKGVLEKSLHGQAIIALGLEERFNAVDSPASLAWETPDQPPQTLPPNARVIDQFDQLGADRTLLILGEPGSGKTIALLELARDLIHRANQDVNLPMPVVLNLSSWKGGRQTIAEWLIQELHSQYQVPKQTGSKWIKDEQLLLLLDGLDEVRGDIRLACVQALNQFRQERGRAEIVVTSRIKDYETLKHRLRFSAAIYVQPLTPEQIQHYLAAAGANLTAVSTALQTDTQLQELAKSPLMLNIIAIAYQGMSVETLPSMNLEERRQHLFNAYIERMFSRKSAKERYPKLQTMHWLNWLAQRMIQESQTVFLIERMQPSWLRTEIQKQIHRIAMWVIVGLVCGLSMGLISSLLPSTYEGFYLILAGSICGGMSGLITGLFSRLKSGLIVGAIAALSVGLINLVLGLFNGSVLLANMAIYAVLGGAIFYYTQLNIESINPIKWSWLVAKQRFAIGLILGIFLGIPLWLIKKPDNIIYGLVGWLILMLTVGLVFGITLGFKKVSEVEKKVLTNYGIKTAVKNAVLSGLFGGSIVGIIFYINWWAHQLNKSLIWWIYYSNGNNQIDGLTFALSVGLSTALLGALINGQSLGLICIQHFTLRLALWWNGYVPWNYTRFLDYATERIFLQKVGGGYIFIHRLLLEHFASLRLNQK